ncbi:hypothetical protein [Desulforamulus aeronauticus]|uniref:Uncharacterized protein n=1 Tax=Desulforamulus aeronauticus DSM 10349 TaxID=1121421 RepID=A0A1M6V3D1_9FIRM|nr:hypothetical protein [Desulforamulus aeronauticus]SHK76002.1 hypothetical protein SAMN02745123_03026 [Desulforamulus aeronauticus DSM 10349]
MAFDKYFLNRQSDLDGKSKEEQKQAILNNEEFKDFPEVIELKKQVEETDKEIIAGTNDQNKNSEAEGVDRPSQAKIEADLNQKLTSLQNDYNSKIAGLVNSAKKELDSKQKGGSKKELVQKYIGLSESLESQCDARVYAAINFAENELSKYGYQSSVPAQAKTVYQQTKKDRRMHLLSKL